MQSYDCIIVRLGEIALKSEQVREKWMKIQIKNIEAALAGLQYKIEVNPNRIFIYTPEIKRAMEALRHVFGITSLSPAWTCFAALDEMKVLASKIAREFLDEKKSFAIRPRKAGRHAFGVRTIADEVGAAVKNATGARVDLEDPDVEINVECRSRRAYIFIEKLKGPGGLPLGVCGRVCVDMRDAYSLHAAWLAAKRGCELVLVFDKLNESVLKLLERWHYGSQLKYYEVKRPDLEQICMNEGAIAIISGKAFSRKESASVGKIPIFYPVLFFTKEEIKNLENIINL